MTNRPILKRRQDMTCRVRHAASEHAHQSFPQMMELGQNMNMPRSRLDDCATGYASVYCYVIKTIRKYDGEFVQTGCGPNFQGGLITLCTCKHRMRTSMDVEEWRGTWIAGFTGSSAGERMNFLFYLMRVEHAFASHHDLWFTPAVSSETKQAKAAHLDRFGDIFRPRDGTVDPRDPGSYFPPRADHCHAKAWKQDVSYDKGYGGRPAALLVGDSTRSFLWSRPLLYCSDKLGRGCKKRSLGRLLAQLKTGEPQ